MPLLALIKSRALTLTKLILITLSHSYITLHFRLQYLQHIFSELWFEIFPLWLLRQTLFFFIIHILILSRAILD